MKTKLSYIFLTIFFTAVFASGALSKAVLSGKLLQANGKPLVYTEIELVSLDAFDLQDSRRLLAITNVGGKFTFSDIPVGKYTLSINFDEKPTETSPYATFFYPATEKRDRAEIFEVSDSSMFPPVVFHLPPKLIERKITGIVRWANGDPVSDAFIYINDAEYDDTFGLTDLKTDQNGNFALKAFENRRYQVGAVLFEKLGKTLMDVVGPIMASARSEVFTLNAKTETIELIFEEPEEIILQRDKSIGSLPLIDKTCANIKKIKIGR